MVSLYGQIFGEQYQTHMAEIGETIRAIESSLGEEVRNMIAASMAANTAAAQSWSPFVEFPENLPDCSELLTNLKEIHDTANALLERKRQSPLEVIEDPEQNAKIATTFKQVRSEVEMYNTAVTYMNTLVAGVVVTSEASEDEARQAVTNAKRRIARNHDSGVQRRVAEFRAATAKDDRVKDVRQITQKRLKDVNQAAAGHYHDKVNYYLETFGVSARITKPTNSMAGNAGQAKYSLLIRGESIQRGRGRVSGPVPSFQNTLSTGDKTTLALAFFLAKLDDDGTLDEKIVVFDDPLASHDSHRRGKTVEAIKELSQRCLQLIVLSHDEFFLRDVERRSGVTPKSTYQMEYSDGDEWTAAAHVQLADLCRSDHARRRDKLVAFADHREGDPDDIVLHVRQVLETHFRRSFSAYFPHNQNLGKIVRDIDNHVGVHPCAAVRASLDSINSATCDNHHGDDADIQPKQGVDPDALKVIVVQTLELIGARQPSMNVRPTPRIPLSGAAMPSHDSST